MTRKKLCAKDNKTNEKKVKILLEKVKNLVNFLKPAILMVEESETRTTFGVRRKNNKRTRWDKVKDHG